jgi:Domain of unknown function (DUF1707)
MPASSSSSSSSPWTGGFQYRRRGPHNPGMRVSDAERNAVAEQLSKHYGDGRLTQQEFEERLHKAMNARTQGDFAGLFDDLPDLPDGDSPASVPKPPPVVRHRSGAPVFRLAFFAALIVLSVVAISHVIANTFFLWLVIAVGAFLWLRDSSRRHH